MSARDRLIAHLRAMDAVPASPVEDGHVDVEAEALADALMPFWESEEADFAAALGGPAVVVALGYGGATLSHPSWHSWRISDRGDVELLDSENDMVCTVSVGEWTRVYSREQQPVFTAPDPLPMAIAGWALPTDQRHG